MVDIRVNEMKINLLNAKLNDIVNKISKSAKKGIEVSLDAMQSDALKLQHGSKNKDKILYEVNVENNIVKGRLHTNKDTFKEAMFEEFGTGEYAELPHIGVTKTFRLSGYKFWYVPLDLVDLSRYKLPTLMLPNGTILQLATGQQPVPFMRTTGFQNRSKNVENVKNEISKMIREVVTK